MQVHRAGAGPSAPAAEPTFTGDVRISGYFAREAPSRLLGAEASFPPGARTPWKSNPVGQTLIVTSGVGVACCEGEPAVKIRVGDVIWCPPGERHWEGAVSDAAMTYIALHETGVEFQRAVTDEEYLDAVQAARS